jgi:glutaryl-CoA dehydrogenase
VPRDQRHWIRAEFLTTCSEVARRVISGVWCEGFGSPVRSPILDGFFALARARVGCSIATFVGVHGGLSAGSIYLCGSDEQKERWLPEMARMEKLGSFGLTEPEVLGRGRGIGPPAGATAMTALNGAKRWIGKRRFADLNVTWARDVDDRQVKGSRSKGRPAIRPR